MSLNDAMLAHTLPEGFVIDGKYKILNEIGKGGFAKVYKAYHLQLERELAVKVMNMEICLKDDTYIRRFVREAQVALKIQHNNIVKNFDFGQIPETNQPYIAMEFLNGCTLMADLRENGVLSLGRAFRLFCPVLEALGTGHKLGIVHKDLKPSNLFVHNRGTDAECLKILDFGVARMSSDEVSRLTATGHLVGTLRYLAPEYILNQLVTPTIDVYQIAMIICEVTTGIIAAGKLNTYDILTRHCTGNLHLHPFFKTGKVGEVFSRALSVDYKKRYPDCNAFLRDFKTLEEQFSFDSCLGKVKKKKNDVSQKMRENYERVGQTLVNLADVQHSVPNLLMKSEDNTAVDVLTGKSTISTVVTPMKEFFERSMNDEDIYDNDINYSKTEINDIIEIEEDKIEEIGPSLPPRKKDHAIITPEGSLDVSENHIENIIFEERSTAVRLPLFKPGQDYSLTRDRSEDILVPVCDSFDADQINQNRKQTAAVQKEEYAEIIDFSRSSRTLEPVQQTGGADALHPKTSEVAGDDSKSSKHLEFIKTSKIARKKSDKGGKNELGSGPQFQFMVSGKQDFSARQRESETMPIKNYKLRLWLMKYRKLIIASMCAILALIIVMIIATIITK